jgi:hypothetical protein
MAKKVKEKEIFADLYAESNYSLEVYVKKEDCPSEKIKNTPLYSRETIAWNGEKPREQAVCKCRISSGFGIECPFWEGVKQVQRNKQRQFKVFCGALNNVEESK